jgi:hypothetical protein
MPSQSDVLALVQSLPFLAGCWSHQLQKESKLHLVAYPPPGSHCMYFSMGLLQWCSAGTTQGYRVDVGHNSIAILFVSSKEKESVGTAFQSSSLGVTISRWHPVQRHRNAEKTPLFSSSNPLCSIQVS